MAETDNLKVVLIEVNQSQKETTSNEGAVKFDAAIAAEFVHDFISDADYTLDTVTFENLNAVLKFTDTGVVLTTARNVIVPDLDKIWIIKNTTAQTITVKTLAGTGVACLTGEIYTVQSDSVNVTEVSSTVAGAVPYASSAEVDTGTEPAKAISPDALAGSNFGTKGFGFPIFDSVTDTAVGDGVLGFCVPAEMHGMNIIDAIATVHTAGTTGTTDLQIRRRRSTTDVDVLSTKLTIDSGEVSSVTAAAALVINAANDDLAVGDLFYVDVDAISTTAAKGLSITIMAQLP